MLYITHDLAVISEMADRVAVMYAGKIVECADVHTIFKKPVHPYTRGLLASIIRFDKPQSRFEQINGEPPDIFYRPNWCAFAPRCKYVTSICNQQIPLYDEIALGHYVRCHRWEQLISE